MAQEDRDLGLVDRVYVRMRTISNSRCPFDTLEENRMMRWETGVPPLDTGPPAATLIVLQNAFCLRACHEFSGYNPEGFGWAP